MKATDHSIVSREIMDLCKMACRLIKLSGKNFYRRVQRPCGRYDSVANGKSRTDRVTAPHGMHSVKQAE